MMNDPGFWCTLALPWVLLWMWLMQRRVRRLEEKTAFCPPQDVRATKRDKSQVLEADPFGGLLAAGRGGERVRQWRVRQ